MITITASATISMGHRLPSYDGICSSPHGHNVRVEVVVALLDQRSFLDFKDVKKALLSVIDPMDHAMVLFREDPFLKAVQGFGFRHYVMAEEPTTENIAWEIFRELQHKLDKPGQHAVTSVTVHETEKYAATVTV